MNLNLETYTIADLEKLFKLSTPYTTTDVFVKESLLRTQLLEGNVEPALKKQLGDFLSSAKERLTDSQEALVEKPIPESNPSHNEPYVPGTINPYQRRTMTKCLNIDTVFRASYATTSATDFHLTLPESLRNVVSMRLASIELPNMAYEYSKAASSNSFQITTNVKNTVVTQTVYVPDGSYQSDVFATTMNNVFINNGLPFMILEITAQGKTVIRARTETEGVSVYLSSSDYYTPDFAFTLVFQIEGRRPSGTAGWNMGFRLPSYDSTEYTSYETGVVYKSYAVSESMFGSDVPNYVFMEVDDFHNNFQTDTIQSSKGTSYLGNNLLGRITLTTGAFTIVNSSLSDGVFRKREYFGPVRLERLHVRILNRHGEVVDLNGNDYSFVLEFEIVYS
jgi:hypothetical protein